MIDDAAILSLVGELLRAPEPDIRVGLARVLDRLGRTLGGRARLFRDDGEGGFPDVCAPDGGAGPAPAGRDPVASWAARLGAGRAIHVAGGAEGAAELILAPVVRDGALRGFLCVEGAPADESAFPALSNLADLVLSLLDRRDAEERQTEAARRLSAMLAALPELLFEVDADERYTGFHAGPTRLMAQPPGHLRGRKLSEVLPPEVLDICVGALRTALAEGYVANVVYALDLADGRHVFELCGARKEPSEPEGLASVVFLVRDISHRHAMQEELRRLGHVVQAMSNLAILIDTGLRVVWVNPAFERHSGWTLDEIRGRPIKDLVRCPESDPEVAAALDVALREARPFAGRTVNQDRHGRRYWVEFNVQPLFGPDGVLEGFVSIETDVTALKQQEMETEAMAGSAAAAHRLLENAIQALPDAAIVFDPEERIVVSNPAFASFFPSLAQMAVPGTSLRDLLRAGAEAGVFPAPQDERELESWLDSRLVAYRQPYYADEIELPDGRWLRRVQSRIADGGLIGIAIDVTTRRRHIAALDAMNQELVAVLRERNEARRRLVSIISGAQVGTWELDIPTGMLTVGGHWAQIIGREDEIPPVIPLERTVELIHPDDYARLSQNCPMMSTTGARAFECELRMRHRDGSWIWVMSRGQVVGRDETGAPLRAVGVHLDISERKRLEQEVEAGQQHLRSAMESSVAAIALYDHEGVLLYRNAEAARILHLVPGSRDGEAPWRFEDPEGRPLPPGARPYERARAAGAPLHDIRFAARWPDGSRRILTCNASSLDAGEGRTNVVLSFWDITDQLAATGNLEQALARAEEMSRAKSVFLANMSHEIRTPLNGVLGLAEVLDMQITDPEQKRMIASIRQSGETLLTVLNSILDMSKIEAGKMELEIIPFALRDVVSEVGAVYAIQAEEKGLEFEVFCSRSGDVPRLGDPHRIRQILHNLLNNAVKFTSHGTVTLDVSCRPGRPVTIEVTDTGTGMTGEQAARVFESFEQAEGGTTRRFGGTGLGLSIVRELVEMMGGRIALDSAPERGTRVTVTLPLAEPASAPSPAPSPPAVPAAPARPEAAEIRGDLAGLRILGADDNAANREVLSHMLARTGAELRLAENGELALDLWRAAHARAAPFDVVLLDIAMPVLDGPATLDRIRAAEREAGLPRVRVVAVTGHAGPEQVAALAARGFDAHLSKPFAMRRLIETLAAPPAG